MQINEIKRLNEEEQEPDISNDSSPIGNLLLLDNLWACDDIPCIEAVLFGLSGERAAHKRTEVIRDVVLQFIGQSFQMTLQEIQDLCVDCHVTRWEEDPFSYGAYSQVTLGATPFHAE